jgi:hypothetical protein
VGWPLSRANLTRPTLPLAAALCKPRLGCCPLSDELGWPLLLKMLELLPLAPDPDPDPKPLDDPLPLRNGVLLFALRSMLRVKVQDADVEADVLNHPPLTRLPSSGEKRARRRCCPVLQTAGVSQSAARDQSSCR